MKQAKKPDAQRREAEALRRRLAHDVGKYVGRTARNLAPGPVPPPLLAMLRKDLYALPGGRASAVFESFAARLECIAPDPRLPSVRALLREADALEGAIAAGDTTAALRAAAIARDVEERLRALARGAASETP